MKYKVCLLFLSFIVFNQFVYAHNTQQASFNITLDGKKSVLDITLSQYGVEQALFKSNPKLGIKPVDLMLFKEALITHLKKRTSIEVNGRAVKLGTGLIKLGSHQSNLKFKLENVSDTPTHLKINQSSFNENHHQTNIVTVTSKKNSIRKMLDKSNNFKASFILKEDKVKTNKSKGA